MTTLALYIPFLFLLPPLAHAAAASNGSRTPHGHAAVEVAPRPYRALFRAGGLQAPNRPNNFHTIFDGSGIRVVDRSAKGSPDLLALSLARMGRGAQHLPVGTGELHAAGSRIEIHHTDFSPGFVEWYENSEMGLEQGFTLTRPFQPPAADDTAPTPLVLELQVEIADARQRGSDVVFETPTGRSLRYGGLFTVDATGRTLPSVLEVARTDTLRLVIDDSEAVYPITIDPLLSDADAVIESDQPGASLRSVAVAGHLNDDVYDDLIVASVQYDNPENAEGRVRVFNGSASGIEPLPSAVLEIDDAGALFGYDLDGAGDVNCDGYDDVIVGARGWNLLTTEAFGGGAFVYHGSAAGIDTTVDAVMTSGSTDPDDWFGQVVAGAGNVDDSGCDDVIVGDWRWENVHPAQKEEGAAFVFYGSDPSGVAPGSSLVAPRLGSAADVILQLDLTNMNMGFAVDGVGDVNDDTYDDVISSAISWNSGGTPNEGAVFVHFGGPGGPSTTADVRLEGNQYGACFGWSAAGAGDVNGDGISDIVVGATACLGGPGDAIYVFHGTSSWVTPGGPDVVYPNAGTAQTVITSAQPGAEFGFHVDGAGDVNGDGYDDIIVGAPKYDVPGGAANEGAAFVFLGSASGIASGTIADAYVRLEGTSSDELFGFKATGGDINNDGISDVFVGSAEYENGQTNEGAIFVYMGQQDLDGDRLTDAEESGIHSTDPMDSDSDDDGLDDGAEVALGTNPLDPDSDGDLVCDGAAITPPCTVIGPDNCPFVSNFNQDNADPFSAGDDCQCGDVNGDNAVTALDLQIARENLVNATLSGSFDVTRCDYDRDASCGVDDTFVLDQILEGQASSEIDACTAYGGP